MMPAIQHAESRRSIARRIERPRIRLRGRRAAIAVQLDLEKLLAAAVIEQAVFVSSIRREVLSEAERAFRAGAAYLLPPDQAQPLQLLAERIARLLAAARVLGRVQIRRSANLPLSPEASASPVSGVRWTPPESAHRTSAVSLFAELDNVAPQRAIEYLRGLPILTRQQWEAAIEAQRGRAFRIAGVSQQSVLEGMRELIARSLESGLSPQQFERAAGELLRNYEFGATRLRTIWNTNVGQALAQGRDAELREVSDVLPWRLFDAMNDSFTRPNHAALDNGLAPATWWDANSELKPLLGFNCRCVLIAMTAARAQRLLGEGGYTDLREGVPAGAGPDPGWGA